MIENKLVIVVGKDGRPSMKGVYSKMKNNSELWVRRKLSEIRQYWRVYTNHNVDDFEKINVNNDLQNPTFKDKILVRWGNIIELAPFNCIVYNKIENIKNATDKALARHLFINNNVSCPKFVDPATIKINQFPVIARPKTHAKGKNFVILKDRISFTQFYNENQDWYYSEFIDKVAEFRLHAAHGRILNYLEKPNPNNGNIAWNRALNGEAFENVKWSDYNGDVCYTAIQAINALGLDFGGVDVMVDAKGKVYVLEVNTAATLASSEYSMERYAMYFDWLCKTNKRREHWPLEMFENASNYAWHKYHFEDRKPNKVKKNELL